MSMVILVDVTDTFWKVFNNLTAVEAVGDKVKFQKYSK